MSLRTLRFAFIFALGLPAHLPAQAFAGPPARPGARPYPTSQTRPPSRHPAGRRQRPAPLQKWNNSGHHYCDAKVLGSIWRTSAFQAKKVAGRKMNQGDFRSVQSALRQGRKVAMGNPRAACNYHEAGYTYRDAEVLAGAWRVPVAQAKTTIVRKVLLGQDTRMRKTIARRRTQARRTAPVGGRRAVVRRFAMRSTSNARKAFFGAGHGYCDAKALGAMWRTSAFQAKAMAGYMLIGGGQKTLMGSMHMSRKLAGRTRKGFCSFSEAGFKARDAATLGRAWRMSPQKARVRAERKLLWGGESRLRAILRGGRR